jgi:hypothetical protein
MRAITIVTITIILLILQTNTTFVTASGVKPCNCVEFRLDDIRHDYDDIKIDMEIIKTVIEKGGIITAGIVGSEFNKSDTDIINYMKPRVDRGEIILANHGWRHENFSHIDKNTASSLLKKTNDRLKSIFGMSPTIFIPPFNRFVNSTLQAMSDQNLKTISASTEYDKLKGVTDSYSIHHYPSSAETGFIDSGGNRLDVDANKEIEKLNQNIRKDGYVVITLHPYEFTIFGTHGTDNKINGTALLTLSSLIDKIHQEGYKINTRIW